MQNIVTEKLSSSHRYTDSIEDARSVRGRGLLGVLISISQDLNRYVVLPVKSVFDGKCDAGPTVTFPAAKRHRLLAGTWLHACWQSGYTQPRTDLASHLRPLHRKFDAEALARQRRLECGPMPNMMSALPNIRGALCSTPQSLADARY